MVYNFKGERAIKTAEFIFGELIVQSLGYILFEVGYNGHQ
jgi:hypothetical protein